LVYKTFGLQTALPSRTSSNIEAKAANRSIF